MDAVAQPGVHDEGEPLAGASLAHLVEGDAVELAEPLDPPDVRPGDAVRRQSLRQHPAGVRLHEAVAVRLDGVREPPRLQDVRLRAVQLTVGGDRPLDQLDRLAVGGGIPQPVEEVLSTGRIVGGDAMRHPVEVDPLDHPGQAQRVVTVEVGDTDPVQVMGGDPGAQHLPLRSSPGSKSSPSPSHRSR